MKTENPYALRWFLAPVEWALWPLVVGVLAMSDNDKAVTLFSAPLTAPITVVLKEKYGTTLILDKVTAVIDRDGSFWITRNGTFFGEYPKENYSVSKQKE